MFFFLRHVYKNYLNVLTELITETFYEEPNILLTGYGLDKTALTTILLLTISLHSQSHMGINV